MRALELLRPALRELKAYEPEEALGEIALDANENPYAPPSSFLEEAQRRIGELKLNRYPDPSCRALLEGASHYYKLGPDCLLAGNGSDELIAALFVAFGGPGRKCLLASPSFSMYALCAKGAGWEVLEEPLEADWSLGTGFLERASKERPALIILGTPNNPTGNAFSASILDRLLDLESVLVLDEAYVEFSGASRMTELARRPNLIVLRTMSKAFGLAGLRLGFLGAQAPLVSELNKLRLPYNVDQIAQALGSLAFSRSEEFRPSLNAVAQDKPRLAAALRALPGAKVYSSDANFFLFELPEASKLHQDLLKQGIRLRRFRGGRLENCLRICVGTKEEMERCFQALKEWKP